MLPRLLPLGHTVLIVMVDIIKTGNVDIPPQIGYTEYLTRGKNG
jgi:hypothetical protein